MRGERRGAFFSSGKRMERGAQKKERIPWLLCVDGYSGIIAKTWLVTVVVEARGP